MILRDIVSGIEFQLTNDNWKPAFDAESITIDGITKPLFEKLSFHPKCRQASEFTWCLVNPRTNELQYPNAKWIFVVGLNPLLNLDRPWDLVRVGPWGMEFQRPIKSKEMYDPYEDPNNPCEMVS